MSTHDLHARDLMEPALLVSPNDEVRTVAERLAASTHPGAVVVGADDILLGVVTEFDLVFREAKVHLPSFFTFMDAVVPLGNQKKAMAALERASASLVADMMTREVHTASPDTSMEQLATWLTEDHLTMVPVVEEGQVKGVVTRRGLVRAMAAGWKRSKG